MYPSGLVSQAQLAEQVGSAMKKLVRDVAWIRHSIGEDTGGDPAIHFRIVLKDAACRKDTLADVTEHISTVLMEETRPYEDLGLIPYFNFRSESEMANLSEPEWVS